MYKARHRASVEKPWRLRAAVTAMGIFGAIFGVSHTIGAHETAQDIKRKTALEQNITDVRAKAGVAANQDSLMEVSNSVVDQSRLRIFADPLTVRGESIADLQRQVLDHTEKGHLGLLGSGIMASVYASLSIGARANRYRQDPYPVPERCGTEYIPHPVLPMMGRIGTVYRSQHASGDYEGRMPDGTYTLDALLGGTATRSTVGLAA